MLEAGKHLFLEKPGATSLAAHDALSAAAHARPELRRAGRRTTAASTRAGGRRADCVAAGAIGRPLRRRSSRATSGLPEREHPGRPGGFLLDMASTTTTPRAGSSATSPSRCTRRGRRRSSPSSRRSATSTTPLSPCASTAAHSPRCTSHARVPLGSRRARRDRRRRRLAVRRQRAAGRRPTAADAGGFPQDYRELFGDAYARTSLAPSWTRAGASIVGAGLEEDRRAVAVRRRRARERSRRRPARWASTGRGLTRGNPRPRRAPSFTSRVSTGTLDSAGHERQLQL